MELNDRNIHKRFVLAHVGGEGGLTKLDHVLCLFSCQPTFYAKIQKSLFLLLQFVSFLLINHYRHCNQKRPAEMIGLTEKIIYFCDDLKQKCIKSVPLPPDLLLESHVHCDQFQTAVQHQRLN